MPSVTVRLLPKVVFWLFTVLLSAAAHAQSNLQLKGCWLKGVPHEAQCGTLMRPLDPASPQGTKIGIRFAVIGALARNKKADPIFFFAGGPGQSAVDLAGTVSSLFARALNRRDLVLIDQRGTGLSAPLRCPSADDNSDPLLDTEGEFSRIEACRSALEQLPHGDLRLYTTSIAVQDVDAVRQALGAQQINLVGASYGTRMGLEYMRQFPNHVRRVILDGVSPPDMALPNSMAIDNQRVLDQVMQACLIDLYCKLKHPLLQSRLSQLLADLPREISVTNPVTGRSERITLTQRRFLTMLRMPLYVPALTSALPAALEEAIAGRFEALSALSAAVSGRGGGSLGIADGMHYSVVCSEDVPKMRKSTTGAAVDFGDVAAAAYRRICAGWPKREIPAGFYKLSATTSPTILLSGGADPATPPRHGHRVSQSLGLMARHIVVQHAGHGVMALGCMPDLMYRFIEEVDAQRALNVDARCVQDIPRPGFYND